MTKTYTDKSNARRAAKKAGIPAEHIGIDETPGGLFSFFDMREVNTDQAAAVEAGTEADQAAAALRDELAAGKARHTEGRLRAVAEAGLIPPPPDFSAPTHKPHRAKLAEVVALVEAGDVKKLRAYEIKAISSSPKALARYRDAAVIALTKQAEVAQ